jgi:di/tricarboxylate transporter
MSLAALSLAALLLAVFLGSTTRLNIGLVAIVLAWLVGVYAGGMSLNAVLAGFPSPLFLTLVGVTLLFTQAHMNGTLERVAHQALRLARGNVGLMPFVFFGVALVLSTVGPGNIASTALVAPNAMSVAARAGISPFLMAVMVGSGATAGALSPFAPTGIVTHQLMAKIGLGGREWETYLYNMLVSTTVAWTGYLAFGGWRLFARWHSGEAADSRALAFTTAHWITSVAIVSVLAAVVGFGAHVGMAAFAAAVVLAILRVAPEAEAIRELPWGVILMVSGVTVLVALLTETQGMELFTDGLGFLATPATAPATMAFTAGVLSAYGSTTGVVLPVFLPTVPGLIARLGGGDAMAIASSINVGANLVDVSSLSTIGALCLASVTSVTQSRRLFYQLLAWGLSMAVVGAIICGVLFR